MARARLLSRTLGSSRRFNAVTDDTPAMAEFAQLLFALLIPHTDDFGRMSGDPQTVKYVVFPGSPRPIADFAAALSALDRAKLVQVYAGDDDDIWLQINKFERHQPGLKQRGASKIPDPPDAGKCRDLPGNAVEPTAIPEMPGVVGNFALARARGTELVLEPKRTETKGTETNKERTVAPRLSAAGNGNGHRNPKDNSRVITRLIHTILDTPDHPTGFADLLDLAKTACAQKHIAYNSEIVGGALESALAQRAAS